MRPTTLPPESAHSPTGGSARLIHYLSISVLLNLSTWMLLLLPDFLAQNSWSTQKIGWVMGTHFLVYLICQILAGNLADRYGNVPTGLLGAALALLGGLGYVASLAWINAIFAARILHAVGLALIAGGVVVHLVRSTPPALRGRVVSYFGVPGLVMMAIGPLLAEILMSRWGMAPIFLSVPLTFLLVAGLIWRLPRPLASGFRREAFWESFRANVPTLKPILFFSTLFGICFSTWHSFLAPAVKSIGAGGVSSFSMGYGLGALATRIGISRRLDTGSRRLLVQSGPVRIGPGADSAAGQTWHLMLVGLICGASHGVFYPGYTSIAADRFHPRYTGAAMSLYMSASLLGMFLGPLIWSQVGQLAGYAGIFGCAGFLLAASSVGFVATTIRPRFRLVRWRPTQ